MELFKYSQPFELENGANLPGLTLAYTTYGLLNESRDNVIWVCHALTANANPQEWWPGFWNEVEVFNTSKYFIVCANMIGSCYGSTGPDEINPATGLRYGLDFPLITIRDQVKAQLLLADYLGIERIHLVLGGSMGGQQSLEWTIMAPDKVYQSLLIACNARHSPWGIAFNEAQRLAIQADPTFAGEDAHAGYKGMQAARAMGMISYRHYLTYETTQMDTDNTLYDHRASTYQRYQGEKLSKRFRPLAYLSLSKTMDTHHVGRQRGGIPAALKEVKSRTLIIGIDHDILFPAVEQEYLAQHIPDAALQIIHSDFGHDGFLLEYFRIFKVMGRYLDI